MLVAAGHLALIRTHRSAQVAVTRSAPRVISDEQGVVIVLCLKQQLVFQAVVDDNRVDAAPSEIPRHMGGVVAELRP